MLLVVICLLAHTITYSPAPWSPADVATLPFVRVGFVLRMVVPRMRLARAAADGPNTPFHDVVAIHVAALHLQASIGPWVP